MSDDLLHLNNSFYLIVNADDYGLTPGVSAGIRYAHTHGLVTSTSVLVTQPTIAEEIQMATSETPNLGLGLHLNLTSGKPIQDCRKIRTLLNETGNFYRPSELESKLEILDPSEVDAEWQAQLERFQNLVNSSPDHIDSHHYISYRTPWLFQIMIKLAADIRCPVRMPFSYLATTRMGEMPFRTTGSMIIQAPRILRRYQVSSSAHCITAFYGPHATDKALRNILLRLEPGVTELVCHPGFNNLELMKKSSYHQNRQEELTLLTDNKALSIISERNIRLISWKVLKQANGK